MKGEFAVILFVKNTQSNKCLIAYSEEPKKRYADLQKKSEVRLEFLGAIYGDYEDKINLQHKFDRFKVKGDWFKGDVYPHLQVVISQHPTDRPPPVNMIVVGDGDFSDRHIVGWTLNELHAKKPIGCVTVGGDRPFERWAIEWARQNKVPVREFYPEWRKGRFAGFKVGPKMLRAKFDNKMLLVFLAEKTSPSVATLIRQAEKLGIEVVKKGGPKQ